MAAGKKYSGKDLRIKVGGKVVFHATECSFQSQREIESLATKDTQGKESTLGGYDWSVSTKALVADKPVAGAQTDTKDVLTQYKDGTEVQIEFATETAGDLLISGMAFITAFNIGANIGATATFDASFTGNGDFTVSVVGG